MMVSAQQSMTLSKALYANARSALQIQREYRFLRKDFQQKYFTYVIKLQDGKYYIGNTDNIYMRMFHHYTMSPMSAKWVRTHGPVQKIVEVIQNSKLEDEHYKTLQYCSLYGCENVRGARYCRINPTWKMRGVDEFEHTRTDFHYLSKYEISKVDKAVRKLVAEYHCNVAFASLSLP